MPKVVTTKADVEIRIEQTRATIKIHIPKRTMERLFAKVEAKAKTQSPTR